MTTQTLAPGQPVAETMPPPAVPMSVGPSPIPHSPAVEEEPRVYRGDWLALQLWILCALVLVILHVVDFLAGLFRQAGPIW